MSWSERMSSKDKAFTLRSLLQITSLLVLWSDETKRILPQAVKLFSTMEVKVGQRTRFLFEDSRCNCEVKRRQHVVRVFCWRKKKEKRMVYFREKTPSQGGRNSSRRPSRKLVTSGSSGRIMIPNTHKVVENLLKKKKVQIQKLPLQSLDLNPIETWKCMPEQEDPLTLYTRARGKPTLPNVFWEGLCTPTSFNNLKSNDNKY